MRRIVLALLVSITLAAVAAEPWQEKPYTGWDKKLVQKVLFDSPWGRPDELTVWRGQDRSTCSADPNCARRMGMTSAQSDVPVRPSDGSARSNRGPGGDKSQGPVATDGRKEVRTPVVVQWASSLTIRQGMVRQWQLQGRSNEQRDKELLAFQFQQYVISVAGDSKERVWKDVSDLEAQSEAWLSIDGGEHIPALAARHTEKGPDSVGIDFYFPRAASDGALAIPPGSKKAVFHCKLHDSELNIEFDLTQMVRAGAPDL